MRYPELKICCFFQRRVLYLNNCGFDTLRHFVPRPELLGLFERITIYAYQLWIFILAYLLIKEQPEQVESGE